MLPLLLIIPIFYQFKVAEGNFDKIDASLDRFESNMNARFDQINTHFDQLNLKFDENLIELRAMRIKADQKLDELYD